MDAVPPGEPINLSVLTAWTEKNLGHRFLKPRLEPLGAGRSNLTFLLEDEGQGSDQCPGRVVVRRPPVVTGLSTAHDVEREAAIMAALADSPVPVPRVYAVVTDPILAGGAPVVLLEYVEGAVLDSEHALMRLDPSARRQVGVALAQTLARIHNTDVDSVGLGQLASREPYAPRQLRRWSRQWEQVRSQPWDQLEDLTRQLWALAPNRPETTLVHGDYGLANVLVDAANGMLTAVLDWELSTLGHPLADLGALLAYWSEPGAPTIGSVSGGHIDGSASAQDLIDAYEATAERELEDLGFWRALALWKLAIIGTDVLRRDESSDEAAVDIAAGRRTVEALVGHAWAILG